MIRSVEVRFGNCQKAEAACLRMFPPTAVVESFQTLRLAEEPQRWSHPLTDGTPQTHQTVSLLIEIHCPKEEEIRLEAVGILALPARAARKFHWYQVAGLNLQKDARRQLLDQKEEREIRLAAQDRIRRDPRGIHRGVPESPRAPDPEILAGADREIRRVACCLDRPETNRYVLRRSDLAQTCRPARGIHHPADRQVLPENHRDPQEILRGPRGSRPAAFQETLPEEAHHAPLQNANGKIADAPRPEGTESFAATQIYPLLIQESRHGGTGSARILLDRGVNRLRVDADLELREARN